MPRGYGVHSTTKKKKDFLAKYAKLGNITYAAKEAGIDRTTHFKWIAKDEAYAAKFASAREEAADLLEAEVLRRGVQGVDEPVFYQGEVCGYIRKYSDVLLIFLLKGTRPEKFRDRMEIADPQGRNPLLGALEDMWEKIEARRNGTKQVIEIAPSKEREIRMGESPRLLPVKGKFPFREPEPGNGK